MSNIVSFTLGVIVGVVGCFLGYCLTPFKGEATPLDKTKEIAENKTTQFISPITVEQKFQDATTVVDFINK